MFHRTRRRMTGLPEMTMTPRKLSQRSTKRTIPSRLAGPARCRHDPGTRHPPRDHVSRARRPTSAPPRVADQHRRATADWEGQPATSRARQAPGAARRTTLDDSGDEPRTRRWWPFIVTLIALAVIISLLTPSGRHEWAVSLFRQPTRYTALSFNKAAALPRTAAVNQPIPVSFTISNQEGRTEHYRYVLSDSAAGYSHILGGSSKVVPPGATWRVSTVVRPTCTQSPCQVEVALPGYPETIDFIVMLTPGQS